MRKLVKFGIVFVLFILGVIFVFGSSTLTDQGLVTTGNVTAGYYCNSTDCYPLVDFLQAGTDTQKTTTGFYLYNNSATLYFNETLLNDTIDSRASGIGDNASWNESYANTLYMDIGESIPTDISDLTWDDDWMIAYSDNDELKQLTFNDDADKFLMSNGEAALSWETPETYNVTYAGCVNNASYLSTYNVTYAGSVNNASYLSTYNLTYLGCVNNATYISTYNATYDANIDANCSVAGSCDQVLYWDHPNQIDNYVQFLTSGAGEAFYFDTDNAELGIGVEGGDISGSVHIKDTVPDLIFEDTDQGLDTGTILYQGLAANPRFVVRPSVTGSGNYPAFYVMHQEVFDGGAKDLIFLLYTNDATAHGVFETYKAEGLMFQTRNSLGDGDMMFRTDTSEVMLLDNTGNNVMIGAGGNPQGMLDVSGGMSIGTYAGSNAPPANGMIVSGDVGIGTTSILQTLTVAGNCSAYGYCNTTDCYSIASFLLDTDTSYNVTYAGCVNNASYLSTYNDTYHNRSLGIFPTTQVDNVNYSVLSANYYIFVNNSDGNVLNLTLPSSAPLGKAYFFYVMGVGSAQYRVSTADSLKICRRATCYGEYAVGGGQAFVAIKAGDRWVGHEGGGK